MISGNVSLLLGFRHFNCPVDTPVTSSPPGCPVKPDRTARNLQITYKSQ